MKLTLGCIRRADNEFGLIQPGDCVALGVSGGKDSLLLLRALSLYRKVRKNDFTLIGIMLTMGETPPDTSLVEAYCKEYDVELTVRYTDFYQVLFDIRKDKNPCSLCAKMRRGVLCELAKELGANKIALGHHREDALETLLMSLIYESRMRTFHPKTYMSKTDITVIRPMVYLPEEHVLKLKEQLKIPVLKNPCPANGHTKRQEMKELLLELQKRYPKIKDSLLLALRNDDRYDLWDKVQ